MREKKKNVWETFGQETMQQKVHIFQKSHLFK